MTTNKAKTEDEVIYTVSGQAHFAKVHEPQTSKNYEDKGPSFGIGVVNFVQDKSMSQLLGHLKKHKLKNEIHDHLDADGNDTGKVRINLSRKAFLDENDKVQNYPIVVDKYGDKLPKTTLIGNGSEVIVSYKLRSYTNKKTGKDGHALTFTGVQVVNLVPYESTGFKEKNVFQALADKPADDITEEYESKENNNASIEDY